MEGRDKSNMFPLVTVMLLLGGMKKDEEGLSKKEEKRLSKIVLLDVV